MKSSKAATKRLKSKIKILPAKPPRSTPVLDQELVSTLSEMLSRAELEGLLGRAEGQLSALVELLRRAWADRNLTSTEGSAHKLAGLAGTIGCLRVMASARKIEAGCRGGAERRLHALFADLERTLPPAYAALARWRSRMSASR